MFLSQVTRMPTLGALIAVALVLLCRGDISCVGAETDLCRFPGCRCVPNAQLSDLVDVTCQCKNGQAAELSLGPRATQPPLQTVQLDILDCRRVHLLSQSLNAMPRLANLSISRAQELKLHSRLYDARQGTGDTRHLHNIEIGQVRKLLVSRQTFDGLSLDGSFLLQDTSVPRVPPLTFKFDFVNEFSVFASTFERVAMWGFKMERCREFNVLANSSFSSLATHAWRLRCHKFMVAYNSFGSLHDSSFDVEYGMADIQGNTFRTLVEKPFKQLRPMPLSELPHDASFQPGFVFRENKFASDPSLPFGSLAMPAFEQIDSDDHYVNVDLNHFPCDCSKLDWFLGAMIYNFDRAVLEDIGTDQLGFGTLGFLRRVFDTAGQCLVCEPSARDKCRANEEAAFLQFAETALTVEGNELRCTDSDQKLRDGGATISAGGTQPLGPSSYNYEGYGYESSKEEYGPGDGDGDGDGDEVSGVSDEDSGASVAPGSSFQIVMCAVLLQVLAKVS